MMSHICFSTEESVDVTVVTSMHSIYINNSHLPFLKVAILNFAKCCLVVGMSAGSLHVFPAAAKFGEISSSYNKTTPPQVNIHWSQVKVNLVL